MKFTLGKARIFGWKGLKAWAYSSKEDFKNASTAYLELTRSHGKVKTTLSDRVYYVVGGEGEFVIKNKVFKVSKNDVIIVPKNTIYDYKATKGTLKLFLIHIPAYDGDYEVRYEAKQ